jgi:hypothetical protein
VWLLRLGSPGVHQLDMLPGRVTGIPSDFKYHPFHYIDHKEQASIKKRPAQRSAVRTSECKHRFYMDFGFMRASTSDYARPNKSTDRVVSSYGGYTSYLLVVDEASRMAWVFLTKSKDPPIDIVRAFLTLRGHSDGGCVRTDQGGELASSGAFRDLLLREFSYSLEPTGADSPSQNGAVEIYNDKLGIRTRALLYGAGLPAKNCWFWGCPQLCYPCDETYTRKITRQDDWSEWQTSEFLQLDQFDSQDMFGSPEAVESNEAVFNLVWSYGINALDARKKARCTCDGSPRSGQVSSTCLTSCCSVTV